MKTKTFIGISFIIDGGKVTAICSSAYSPKVNPNGLTVKECLDYFLSLRKQVKKGERVVFVSYGLAHDIEFLFQDLNGDLKDKLFEVGKIRKEILDIELDQSHVFRELREAASENEVSRAKLERDINKLALTERDEIYYEGYKLQSRNGRSLEIMKDKKRFILYDAYGFFRTSLSRALRQWLDQNLIQNDNALQSAYYKANATADLMTELNNQLQSKGIKLSRYHGTGAIATWILNKGKAKESFKSYKYSRFKSFGYDGALLQAYYAGRVEQTKIGALNQSVYVYDINSAYAYASTLLPVFLTKMKAATEWQDVPFALWHCEYDFTKVSPRPYLGFLPFRRKGTNEIDYRLKGRGFYWQPEIAYIKKRYPDCVKITGGYVLPFYEVAPFTEVIKDIYDKRLTCKRNGEPLADVLKLALSSVYGKFCQRNNKGFYTNRAYAGFITSVVRAQMMKAVEGKESSVICFLTDAIHTTERLDVKVGDELGSFKRKEYAEGFYLDNGVYQLKQLNGAVKQATRGQIAFDFEKAKQDFYKQRSYSANLEFLVGHGLYRSLPLRYDYLSKANESRRMEPLETEIRNFERVAINNIFESKVAKCEGLSESGIYLETNFGSAGVTLENLIGA